MSIATEITRLQGAKADIKASIEGKGVTVPSNATLDTYDSYIDQITGGGGGVINPSLINFYDYDGSLVAAYTGAEIQTLTSLPSAPDHSSDEVPLSFDEWNWSLSDIKAYNTAYPNTVMMIGANYHTTDGKTHLFYNITTDYDGNSVQFTLGSATGTINWGDGTIEAISSINCSHVYTSAGLYHVIIDSSSTSIVCGKAGSQYCYKLIEVYLSASITAIDYSAFYDCRNLQKISVPDSVTSISSYVFNGCYNLQSITIPSSITTIYNSSFYNCYNLQSIAIPKSVTIFENYSIYNCYNLQSITIPSSVTSIGSYAFYGCTGLTSIEIPSSVTSIEDYAFAYCYSLQSITIPSSITSIGTYAFQRCYCLQDVTVSPSVTEIKSNCFRDCSSLQSITISSSITSIGSNAFYNCYSMYAVILEGTTPPTLTSTGGFSSSYQKKFLVPYSADHSVLAAYQSANNWSSFASLMEEMPQA